MVGVLRHRPKGNADIVPEVGRVGGTELALFGLFPVFGKAVDAVGRFHPSFHLDRLDIEMIVLGL